ncbi:MAG: uracil phosphoribosyltransferase [Lewinellaceae bacterium]|nr:uracil phosphoribosyltransferase [Saprospiraceae bacterium]MCB9316593.1 uracil phosphoribosyltransferase [Lewinellaceae bacterium]MCB9331550.1 uracil phosphoribosyltransferase [Lewinellaceae bacterium]
MHTILTDRHSVANQFIAELRSAVIQTDRMRFRRNLERIGEILAYELSKTLEYKTVEVETPLGLSQVAVPADRLVLASILRAGIPLHQGMLNYFDKADNAFISAYRRQHKDGSFDIQLEYVSCCDLNDAVLILCDPMLATGASMNLTLKHLERFGAPKSIHIAAVIASTAGLEAVQREHPEAQFWLGALDEELTGKAYIVPGLGDAGDLAFGEKS